MSAVTMVVHTEGPGDQGRPPPYAHPGDSLQDDDLGPVHEIVRRAMKRSHQLPAAALDFRAPFRTSTGAPLEGSHLLKPKLLDQALGAWLLKSPVVILLVDADSVSPGERAKILRAALTRNHLVGAVGVAVKEFESWLLADRDALQEVFGSAKDVPEDLEALDRTWAKEGLAEWCAVAANQRRSAPQIRRELAARLDLEEVRRRSPSFRRFLDDIAALTLP